jgi:hypothetical protein
MRGWMVAAIGFLALLGGGAGGWLVRARHDRDQMQLIASAALARDVLTSRVHTVEVTKRNSDGS